MKLPSPNKPAKLQLVYKSGAIQTFDTNEEDGFKAQLRWLNHPNDMLEFDAYQRHWDEFDYRVSGVADGRQLQSVLVLLDPVKKDK